MKVIDVIEELDKSVKKKIYIENFGPIKKSNIELNKFTVLMGPQAEGKSTVAKIIYFFDTIKDEIANLQLKYANNLKINKNFYSDLLYNIQYRFSEIFGEILLAKNMKLECFYHQASYIKISYADKYEIKIEFSDNIKKYVLNENIIYNLKDRNEILTELANLFNDNKRVIFIPAGRNLTTILGQQLSYIYASMDDEQKALIDLCTRNYIEAVLKLRAFFNNGIDGLVNKLRNRVPDEYFNVLYKADLLANEILKGHYMYKNGRETLLLDDAMDEIDINYASSGQQEAVWIINLLIYYLLDNKPTFFIIEEPESHLYPNAQKLITELISLASSGNNSCIVTTHSPYVFGALNNLIYSAELYERYTDKIKDILLENNILKEQLVYIKQLSAYYVKNGSLNDAIDHDMKMIDNSLIDGASDDINKLFDILANIDYSNVGDKYGKNQ